MQFQLVNSFISSKSQIQGSVTDSSLDTDETVCWVIGDRRLQISNESSVHHSEQNEDSNIRVVIEDIESVNRLSNSSPRPQLTRAQARRLVYIQLPIPSLHQKQFIIYTRIRRQTDRGCVRGGPRASLHCGDFTSLLSSCGDKYGDSETKQLISITDIARGAVLSYIMKYLQYRVCHQTTVQHDKSPSTLYHELISSCKMYLVVDAYFKRHLSKIIIIL